MRLAGNVGKKYPHAEVEAVKHHISQNGEGDEASPDEGKIKGHRKVPDFVRTGAGMIPAA